MQLESAISGVIYSVIEQEKTVSDASGDALLRYLKQVENSYNRLDQPVHCMYMYYVLLHVLYMYMYILDVVMLQKAATSCVSGDY